MLQRNDEICISVNAVKTEKNNCMVYGVSLSTERIGNQQRSPEKGNVQRLLRKQVGLQAVGRPKW